MNNQLTTASIVEDQKNQFLDANTSELVAWEKESKFAIQALNNSDYLAEAAFSNPIAMQNAIINVAACGISLNPALKHAYLVPRKGLKGQQVYLDISYQGLTHIAMTRGSIDWVQAKIVYANDEYINNGIDKAPTHNQKTFGDKGNIVGAYCVAKTKGGDYLTEEMDIAAIQKVANTSKATNGPWKQWWEEMARKTVIKRASKHWPTCEAMSEAASVINEHEGLEAIEKPVSGSVVFDTINEDEAQILEGAIVASGKTVEAFCSHKQINISSLLELPIARYEGALNWVRSKSK